MEVGTQKKQLTKGNRIDYKRQNKAIIEWMLFVSWLSNTNGAYKHSFSSWLRHTYGYFSRFKLSKLKAHKTTQIANVNSDSSGLVCHFLLLLFI